MLIALLARPALALSCIWGVSEVNITDGQTVPRDVQIVVGHTFEAGTDLQLGLVDDAGAEVPIVVDVDHHVAHIRPVSPFEPGTYTLVGGEEVYTLLPTFTVVDEVDTDAPATPVLVSAERQGEDSEWGRTEGIAIEVTPIGDASHYEFEIDTDPSFSNPLRVTSVYESAFIGQGLCLDSAPTYAHSERYHARARAIDASGNASEWTTSAGAVRGCSSTGSGGSLLLIGLAALFGRRRR